MKKSFSISFQSNPAILPEIEEYFVSILKDLPIERTRMNNLMLSLAEASSNAIIHGNKSRPEKLVQITTEINDTSVKIFLKDQGEGFSPEGIPDPTSKENIMKESGRGLFIMRAFLDKLEYCRMTDGTLTILTMNFRPQ